MHRHLLIAFVLSLSFSACDAKSNQTQTPISIAGCEVLDDAEYDINKKIACAEKGDAINQHNLAVAYRGS